MLRIYDIVAKAGSGFAFPSQTLYMARDSGLDATLAQDAKETVGEWRRKKKLPFPRLSAPEMERLEDTLDYPPLGSSETDGEGVESGLSAERLSSVEEGVAGAGLENAGQADDRRKSRASRSRA